MQVRVDGLSETGWDMLVYGGQDIVSNSIRQSGVQAQAAPTAKLCPPQGSIDERSSCRIDQQPTVPIVPTLGRTMVFVFSLIVWEIRTR